MNWRGRPLTSLEVIVNLIAGTKTTSGLSVASNLDEAQYPTRNKVENQELAEIEIKKPGFHGDWNYTIFPS
jgi:hypothetical protein